MSKPIRWSTRVLALAFGLVLTLVVGEVGARIWVAIKWPTERVEQLTRHTTERGRFASHPNLPFALNPAWPGHNAAGCRGPEVAKTKPAGTRRVACIGASTTYGLHVEPEQAYPAVLAKQLAQAHGAWEAINAGVPGWVSTEILTNFVLRILPLQPDVVVLLEGRNEVFPQAYANFAADYSHYRRAGFSFAVSNYAHKRLFAWSRFVMVACTLRGERFGWSEREEHPLYGGIFWANQPTPAAVATNLADPARLVTWRHLLESVAALCKDRGITLVFCTMGFVPSKLQIDELEATPELPGLFAAQVERNNTLVREVGTRRGVPVVDGASLARSPELFEDDCHMNAEGHRRRAELVFNALAPLLSNGR